jgi:hypothetical protein
MPRRKTTSRDCPGASSITTWIAPVERGADAAREAGAPQRGRAAQRTVAADELLAVRRHRSGHAVGGVDV